MVRCAKGVLSIIPIIINLGDNSGNIAGISISFLEKKEIGIIKVIKPIKVI